MATDPKDGDRDQNMRASKAFSQREKGDKGEENLHPKLENGNGKEDFSTQSAQPLHG